MFAVTGKIWSIDKVEYNEKTSLQLVIKKKRKEQEISLCFGVYRDAIMQQFSSRELCGGDYVEVKFSVKSREYNGKYYTNLYVDNITMLRKGSRNNINMFDATDEDYEL
jgi:hypothetical protein